MSEHAQARGHWRFTALVAAAILVIAGVVAVAVALTQQQAAPAPQTTPEGPVAATHQSHDGHHHRVLPRSIPTHITVPAIDVDSSLVKLGLNPDGTMHTPSLDNVDQAGWYKYSPTPGQRGPAVIVGHIDSAEEGPGVFFKLGAMTPGEKINVTRADGTVAVFTVDKLEQYPKKNFPTKKVYGDTPNAQLRLISCGGAFNEDERSYVDNIVVYAHLSGSHRA